MSRAEEELSDIDDSEYSDDHDGEEEEEEEDKKVTKIQELTLQSPPEKEKTHIQLIMFL